MISAIFWILFSFVLWCLIKTAMKMTWSVGKVLLFIVFSPLILILFFVVGLFVVAIPLLILLGLISLIGLCI